MFYKETAIYLEPGQAFFLSNKTLIVYKECRDAFNPCYECYYHKKNLPCYTGLPYGLPYGPTHVYCKTNCHFEESEEGL